jgi:hypothetical protein
MCCLNSQCGDKEYATDRDRTKHLEKSLFSPLCEFSTLISSRDFFLSLYSVGSLIPRPEKLTPQSIFLKLCQRVKKSIRGSRDFLLVEDHLILRRVVAITSKQDACYIFIADRILLPLIESSLQPLAY